jgi:hypothetical protein
LHTDCLGSLFLQHPIRVIRIGNWGLIHIYMIIWIHVMIFCLIIEVKCSDSSSVSLWFFCTTWVETWWESLILLMNQLKPDILPSLTSPWSHRIIKMLLYALSLS